MSRNVRFGMLAVAALLVAVATGILPTGASALPACPCYCDPEIYNTPCWGKGNSCSEAQANFPSACAAAAREFCWSIGYDTYCSLSSTITSACWFDAGIGMYVFDGYGSHRCKWCDTCNDDPILQ